VVECINNIPDNIQYLDIVSLQHSGGVDDAETYMKLAVTLKKVKPELLLSIGCYDDPSKFVDAENSLGQTKTSWAVHYYLANMLEKRLRGLPATDASREAFGEGFLLNALDPISWAGVLAIGIGMEDKVSDGYMGSQPNIMTPDFVVRNTISDSNEQWSYYVSDKGKLAQLRAFEAKVEALLTDGKIKLKKRNLKLLRDSEAKLAALASN
jgi:hypothetical protein